MNVHGVDKRGKHMEKPASFIPEEPEFPEWREELDRIESILKDDHCIALIFIDASGMNKIEAYYGKGVYDEVLRKLKHVILGLQGKHIRREDILATNFKKGNLFFVFLSQKRDKKVFDPSDFEAISNRVDDHINRQMSLIIDPLLRERMRINVGYAVGIRNSLIGTERIVTRMIEDAKQVALHQNFRNFISNKCKLQEIILKEELHMVYQPIVNMLEMKGVGYEALARGPEGSGLESPLILFDIARESGLQFELDRLCRKTAISQAGHMGRGLKLFINLLPMTIQDPEFKGKKLLEFLKSKGVSPKNIVFEVSENQAIENFSIFKDESRKYIDMGFSIAIDDAGTGYSNFKSLVELNMQYIKLDITLIKGLYQNEIKQQIVRSMINISKTIGAEVIAEGIETPEDLKVLLKLGIQFGQGYLFARPAFPFPEITIPG